MAGAASWIFLGPDDDAPDEERPYDEDEDNTIYLAAETFFGEGESYLVEGGAGNDTIGGDVADTDTITLDGGTGDDVLDGSQMNNVNLIGGDGNDTLMTSSHAPSGAGYNVTADGGDGDDRIIHTAPPQVWDANLPRLAGGAGQDSFEISFDESIETFTDDNGVEYSPFDVLPVRSNLAIITDFDPDQDSLQIRLDTVDQQYTVTTAELEVGPATRVYSDTQETDPTLPTDEDGIETRIIVTYESETQSDREMVIIVKGVELNWDDIAFAGNTQPAILIPTG